MIKDHLSMYYELFEDDIIFTPIRSIMIDGHEVAWMKESGIISGESYINYELHCECDFMRGIGWDVDDHDKYTIDEHDECFYWQTARHLRHLELRYEYSKIFGSNDSFILFPHIEEIIFDLIKKTRVNEFIGDSGNARLYDGYFYLPTLGNIIDMPMEFIWEAVEKLVAEKKIGLYGNMILDYYEPLPPSWDEYSLRIEENDLIGIVYLPGHDDMIQQWRLEILKDNIVCYEGFCPLSNDADDTPIIEEEISRLMGFVSREDNKNNQPLSIREIVSYLQEKIGLNLTMYLIGLDETDNSQKFFNKYIVNGSMPLVFGQRLRCAYIAVKLIDDLYEEKMAKSWMFGQNIRLEEDAPAFVIRNLELEEESLFEDIISVAKEFVRSS